MTKFQLLAGLVFVAAVGAAYGKDIIEKVKAALPKRAPAVVTPSPAQPTSSSQALVTDLVTLAELRDRLTTLGCKDGADACTELLLILVEYRPSKK